MFPLFHYRVSPSDGENNNDDDVSFAKRLLGLFGYGRRSAAGPSCFASKEFFDDIRQFQKDNGLKPDGVIAPGGETERTIDRRLREKVDQHREKNGVLSEEIHSWEDIDDSWGDDEHSKRCAFNYLKVDMPTCDGIERREIAKARAKKDKEGEREALRAGSACREQAFRRFSACLADNPERNRPPLPWQY